MCSVDINKQEFNDYVGPKLEKLRESFERFNFQKTLKVMNLLEHILEVEIKERTRRKTKSAH